MMFEAYPGQAAEQIGWKVLEMADRVVALHKTVPGARANCEVEIDGVSYDMVLTVTPTESERHKGDE